MDVPKQASRAMMKEEEATGEIEGPTKPVTTTVGPWWLLHPPVRVFPFTVVQFPTVLCVLLSFCSDKSWIILSHGHTSIISSTIDNLVLVFLRLE